jgi:general stress protein 26
MDSINQNQPEDNLQDLTGQEGIKRIKAMVEKAGVCFFCTSINTHQSFSTRPMAVQKTDDEGNLWFLSASDSNKNTELAKNPAVQLLFQGAAYSDYLTLYGSASIHQDKLLIKELWNPMIKTWFTEGVDDPRITVIKVVPSEGYYWDTKHGRLVAFIKQLAGAALGKTLDDSIEGSIEMQGRK